MSYGTGFSTDEYQINVSVVGKVSLDVQLKVDAVMDELRNLLEKEIHGPATKE